MDPRKNARRGYRDRAMHRRTSPERQDFFTQKEGEMQNEHWFNKLLAVYGFFSLVMTLLFGMFALISLITGMPLFSDPKTSSSHGTPSYVPTIATATAATKAALTEATPSDAVVEGSWLPVDGVGSLVPGQIAIGDVKVDGVIQYDSGSGEATIVVNASSKEVKIYAEWGASRVTGGDLQTLIADQYVTGCDVNKGSCSRVRVVTVTDNGQTVEYFNRPASQ